MNYRSRDAILQIILQQIKDGNGRIRITEIMYKVFLSHYQLKKYMTQLKDSDLIIETVKGSRHNCVYSLTDKGERLLKVFKEMDDMVDFNIPSK